MLAASGVSLVTLEELCPYLSEVMLYPLEAMTTGGRAPALQQLTASHYEREEVHWSPLWGGMLNRVGSKTIPIQWRKLNGLAIENPEWDAMWERK